MFTPLLQVLTWDSLVLLSARTGHHLLASKRSLISATTGLPLLLKLVVMVGLVGR